MITLQTLVDAAKKVGLDVDAPLLAFCRCRLLADVESVSRNEDSLQLNAEGAMDPKLGHERELELKLAGMSGRADAFVGDIVTSFEDLLRNRTDGPITIEKAVSGLMDILQEFDWDDYHRAIIQDLELDEMGFDEEEGLEHALDDHEPIAENLGTCSECGDRATSMVEGKGPYCPTCAEKIKALVDFFSKNRVNGDVVRIWSDNKSEQPPGLYRILGIEKKGTAVGHIISWKAMLLIALNLQDRGKEGQLVTALFDEDCRSIEREDLINSRILQPPADGMDYEETN